MLLSWNTNSFFRWFEILLKKVCLQTFWLWSCWMTFPWFLECVRTHNPLFTLASCTDFCLHVGVIHETAAKLLDLIGHVSSLSPHIHHHKGFSRCTWAQRSFHQSLNSLFLYRCDKTRAIKPPSTTAHWVFGRWHPDANLCFCDPHNHIMTKSCKKLGRKWFSSDKVELMKA